MIYRRFLTAIAVLALICSVGAVVYPLVSDAVYRQRQEEIVLAVKGAAESADTEQFLKERKAAEEYNRSLLMGTADAGDRVAGDRELYEQLMNLNGDRVAGDGVMGVLEIPCIGVSLPIYHGTETEALERGAGHIFGSSLPVGGEGTHAALSGHSGMQSTRMLSDLELMQTGDLFYLYVLGEKLTYRVDQIKTVLPHETGDLNIIPSKDYLTVITCTPFSVNTHRLLVRGERIIASEETQIESLHSVRHEENPTVRTSEWARQYIYGLLLGVLAAFVLFAAFVALRFLIRHHRKRAAK